MSPVLIWNTDGQPIMIGGEVRETENFRFSLPPDFDVIDTAVKTTRRVREKDMPEADAMIFFHALAGQVH